jgi:hypothetical protein
MHEGADRLISIVSYLAQFRCLTMKNPIGCRSPEHEITFALFHFTVYRNFNFYICRLTAPSDTTVSTKCECYKLLCFIFVTQQTMQYVLNDCFKY